MNYINIVSNYILKKLSTEIKGKLSGLHREENIPAACYIPCCYHSLRSNWHITKESERQIKKRLKLIEGILRQPPLQQLRYEICHMRQAASTFTLYMYAFHL